MHTITLATHCNQFAPNRIPLAIAAVVLGWAVVAPSTEAVADTPDGWRLVWADEFDDAGPPDPELWVPEIGFVRNEELQYFTEDPKNARVEDGLLVIEARRESVPNAKHDPGSDYWASRRAESEYTSASLTTRGTRSIRYGRVEVRARLPQGRGVWPAIWLLGERIDEIGWPLCGEIDILEYVGFDPTQIHGTFHTEAYNHMKENQKSAQSPVDDVTDVFHVYAVEWDRDRIDISFDGEVYSSYERPAAATQENWPFDDPHYLLLNFSVGGAWGGMQGVDASVFPQRFEIDYVRVYERE